MVDPKDATRLNDLIDASESILSILEDVSLDEFKKSTVLQAAALWFITIIGEASSRLSDQFKEKHQNVPWSEMTGMRNRVVHEYSKINIDTVWEVVKRDIPDVLDSTRVIARKIEGKSLGY